MSVSAAADPSVSRETTWREALQKSLGDLYAPVVEQVEIAAKYSGYIDRQKEEVGRALHFEGLRLPADLDYLQVSALSIEARQKLQKQRPETLGQASRISGITPATISLLLIHLKKRGVHGLPALEGSAGEMGACGLVGLAATDTGR